MMNTADTHGRRDI